jgi:hypothetical protein
VAYGANVQRLAAHVAVRAQHDERDARHRGPLPHSLGELPPVHYRHHQVQQDQLRRVRLQAIQRFFSIASTSDLETLGLQDLREGLQNVWVVIHHQNHD